MGDWSTIKAKFELHTIEWDKDIKFIPPFRELNQMFIKSGFYTEMPFCGEGYPEVDFTGDQVNDLYITVYARDEAINKSKIVDWFNKQIDYLHPIKAKLFISQDFGPDMTIEYKDRVAIGVMKGKL